MKEIEMSQVAQSEGNEHPKKIAQESLRAQKEAAVKAASKNADPIVDAREAFGFMPMNLKVSKIHWRGLD